MFSQDSDTYRFFKKDIKMMLEKPEGWQEGYGEADALFRTSISYMAYGGPILKEGVLSCFTKIQNGKKYYYQGARCYPRKGEEDVSRDQTILALSSLKFNDNIEELNEIGRNLRYRLSKRFIMTPALWIWIRMICTDNKFYNTLFGLMEIIELLPSVLWNKILRKILGYNKEYSMKWYMDFDPTTGLWHNWDEKGWIFTPNVDWANNGYKLYCANQKRLSESCMLRFMDKTEFPEYAAHLGSWMISFMQNGFLKKILQKIMRWNIEEENYLLNMLMGSDVDIQKIDEYKPMWQFRWSSRFNGTYYTKYLDKDDAKYNVTDKDILYAVKKRNLKGL